MNTIFPDCMNEFLKYSYEIRKKKPDNEKIAMRKEILDMYRAAEDFIRKLLILIFYKQVKEEEVFIC